MSKNATKEEIVIGTIKTIMKKRDFDVSLTPVENGQPEVIEGKSKAGTFKMEIEPSKGAKVIINDQEPVSFNGKSDFYTEVLGLAQNCRQYHKDNYQWLGDKWVKKEPQSTILSRMGDFFVNKK